MVQFNIPTTEVKDNDIVINGQLIGKVTDTVAKQIYALVLGTVQTTNNLTATPNTTATVVKAPTTKTDDKKFPALDGTRENIGLCSVYTQSDANGKFQRVLVRYWENGFTPNTVKFGIKHSLTDGGAVWNKDFGAVEFTSKTKANAWIKAQKERANTTK